MARKPKMTQAERDRRKHERKAERMNAAEAKAYGPMFVHLAPVHTPESVEHRWRLMKAGAAEMDFTSRVAHQAEWIVVQHIERWLLAHTDVMPEEIAKRRNGFNNSAEAIVRGWKRALTGRERLTVRIWTEERPEWVSIPYNREGRRVFTADWPPTPLLAVLTDEQAEELFPDRINVPDMPETADERHFEALAALIRRKP